jgi:hypothetical protein
MPYQSVMGISADCAIANVLRHPANTDVRRGSQSIRELRGVVLKMSKADELMMFQLGHRVPREAAFGRAQVERVDPPGDGLVADRPVLTEQKRAACRVEIAEAELRMEAGVPVAGLVIRARKNGANDKSFAPPT